MTEEREKALIETLNNIAQTEYDKIASIKQAISGGYPTFHAVKDRIKGTTECIEERKR